MFPIADVIPIICRHLPPKDILSMYIVSNQMLYDMGKFDIKHPVRTQFVLKMRQIEINITTYSWPLLSYAFMSRITHVTLMLPALRSHIFQTHQVGTGEYNILCFQDNVLRNTYIYMVGSNGVEVKNARYVIQNSWTHGVMVRDIGRYISIADILTEYRNRCWIDDVQRFIDETLVDTGLTEKLLVHLNDTPTCDYHKMLISNVVTDMLDYHDMFFSHVRAKIECHNRSYIDVPYC